MTYSSLKAEASKNIRELQAEHSSLQPINNGFQEAAYEKLVQKVRETYDSLAEVYDCFYPPLTFDGGPYIRSLHNFLQELSARRILDCACGTGRELIPLAKTGDYNLIIGSDLSAKMLDKARKRAIGLPVKWIQSDWLELPDKVKYHNFDAILCLGNPFAHIPPWSYGRVFSSIYQLLKPGGVFIFNRRNWEAELQERAFQKRQPETTIYNTFPRISLLNIRKNCSKEFFAYFSYHNYDGASRLQLLHFLEVGVDGAHTQKVFKFRCFYVRIAPLKKALSFAGFRQVAEMKMPFEAENFDAYAEEEFIHALR